MKRQLLLFAISWHRPAQRRGDSGGNRSGYEQISQCCPSLFLGWGLPRNCQSAGRRKHGKTTKGNKPLKTILTQCAKSARSVKGSYFSAQYQRIAARRGKNRATLAVAHSMLIAIYHMLKNSAPFRDLGSDYYDSFNRDRKIHSYLKRLKALGWEPDALPGSA